MADVEKRRRGRCARVVCVPLPNARWCWGCGLPCCARVPNGLRTGPGRALSGLVPGFPGSVCAGVVVIFINYYI